MNIKLSGLEPHICQVISGVARAAHRQGTAAYLVGGSVRDILLKRPSKDIDVVIEKKALMVAQDVARAHKVPLLVHDRFGTASLWLPKGIRLDFATARKEIYPQAGSLPVVAPGTLEEDLFRRDFTINAMALRPREGQAGTLIDPFGGFQDLKRKQLKVLHVKSFADDPTRIIRGIRFEQRFGFRFEAGTQRQLRAALRVRVDQTVKLERTLDAFRKTFFEPCPGECLARLARWGALDFFKEKFSVDAAGLRKIDPVVAALKRKSFYRDYDWSLVYLVALLEKVPEASQAAWRDRFPFSRREKEVLLARDRMIEALRRLKKPGLKPSQVYAILSPLPEAAVYYLRVSPRARRLWPTVERYLQKIRIVKPSLSGEDLQALGVVPGPKMGEILQGLQMMKIDGQLKEKRQEVAAVKAYGTGHSMRGKSHGTH